MIKLINIIKKKFRKALIPDFNEITIKNYLANLSSKTPKAPDVVLVQCVLDPYYYGLFGQIVSSLREQHQIRVEFFYLDSLQQGESDSLLNFLAARLYKSLRCNKWSGLYKVFCDDIGYSSTGWRFPLGDMLDLRRAYLCWRKLASKEALLSLVIDAVPVGDLIYDSFLRFKPAPTVKLDDFYLLLVIWQAYRDVRRARKYFTSVRPKLYLTSYSTFVQHGIAARVAIQCEVRVFTVFSNAQECMKELSKNDWVHANNTSAYADDFSKMANIEEKLAKADFAMSARMNGIIDDAINYMRKSAYAESDDPVPDVQDAVVIFLHDFYDSPHIYKGMIFPDFWEWICFTIDELNTRNIRFFIKPHPNQIDLNNGVLDKLKLHYPGISIISSNITNKQLVKAGMICGVTVYGTIAHELAFLGVPTIACGDHPHISFDFCQTAENKDEYVNLLSRCNYIEFAKPEMRRQSLAFYFMHNLNLSIEEQALMSAVFKFRTACCNSGINNGKELSHLLSGISELPGYRSLIARLLHGQERAN